MKKQIAPKSRSVGTGLILNKRTISNLNKTEMNQQVGGARSNGRYCSGLCNTERRCSVNVDH